MSGAVYRSGYTVYERIGRVSDMVAPWPMTRLQAKKHKARLERQGRHSLSLYRCESFIPLSQSVANVPSRKNGEEAKLENVAKTLNAHAEQARLAADGLRHKASSPKVFVMRRIERGRHGG